MLKKTVLILLITLFCYTLPVYSQSKILSEKLITQDGLELTKDTLSKGIWVVLITTYECGYCMRDLPFNNNLLEKYKGKINAFALFENDSTKIVTLESKNQKKSNWTKIPDARKIYEKYWKVGIFPEVHIYNDGKLLKVIADASDDSKRKLTKLLDKLTAIK